MAKSKDQKIQEAKNRQDKRKGLSARRQLELLDEKYGKDKGATKERLRLMELLKYDEGDIPQEEVPKKKFKVKKGQDPLKEKKRMRREAKRGK